MFKEQIVIRKNPITACNAGCKSSLVVLKVSEFPPLIEAHFACFYFEGNSESAYFIDVYSWT